MITIKVPASTANLGPGFDSCGLALELYLTLEIGKEQKNWEIEHALGLTIPKDKNNLIIQTALSLTPNVKARKLFMTSDIPTARGLGSSSAAIVAGIELANQLGELNLSPLEKVRIAARIEGHPDNVAPAILGGFVVASQLENEVFFVQHAFPEVAILAVIPEDELLTVESRNILPDKISYQEAVRANSISNVMVSAVLTEDIYLAGKMMEKDLFHEPYRSKIVPSLLVLRALATKYGSYGTFLSGAGPTILILAPKQTLKKIKNEITKKYPDKILKEVKSTNVGVQFYSG